MHSEIAPENACKRKVLIPKHHLGNMSKNVFFQIANGAKQLGRIEFKVRNTFELVCNAWGARKPY